MTRVLEVKPEQKDGQWVFLPDNEVAERWRILLMRSYFRIWHLEALARDLGFEIQINWPTIEELSKEELS